MKIELTPCYILHIRDYRETSLLLELFSREYGRTGLVAKGAKKNKKTSANNFNLYQKYLISWVSRHELGTLTDIEPATAMRYMMPEKLMSGFYVNEITMRLLHRHEPHPELFDAYQAAITNLINDESEYTVLRYFEKSLLQTLGYGIVLDNDVITGEAITPGKEYYYQTDFGPSQSISGKTGVKVSGETLLQINNESLADERCIKEAKLLMTFILQQYLGTKPLASRELYRAYREQKQSRQRF